MSAARSNEPDHTRPHTFEEEITLGSQRPRLLDLYCCAGGAAVGYRRAGWEVVCELDGRAVDPARRVRREWFDVVGLSIGVESRLEWLRNGITTIRRASRNRGLAVLVGGPVFALHPERAADIGADGCVADARDAAALAAALVEAKADRR